MNRLVPNLLFRAGARRPFSTAGYQRLVPGLAASASVLTAASFAAPLVGLPVVPVAIAVGVCTGSLLPPPMLSSVKPGASFAGATLLRLGIVCVGLKLSLVETAAHLSVALPVVVPTLAASVSAALLLSKALRLEPQFATLVSAGTGVCGITAISTVAPVIGAAEKWIAVAVANVVVFGMLAMLVQPFIAHYLFFGDDEKDEKDALNNSESSNKEEQPTAGLSPSTKAGLYLGVCIHDSSQVLGAAMSFRDAYNDQEAFNVATVTKLTRNSMLVAVVPILGYIYSKQTATTVSTTTKKPPLLPAFVLGFIGMAVLRSTVDYWITEEYKPTWKQTVNLISDTVGTKLCLGMAMAGLGLNTRLDVLRGVGVKPFLVGGGGALVAAVTGYTCIQLLDYRLRSRVL
ncbi:hypothetical protein BCR33DRAFT_846928 [Rhizoclosmatium globosum]|uniref:DUF819-domain-containing protein n=1 Tax=Rhizoclosmatium globosum TaxID=329046 RepID=A0A1Y2CTW1_9FUNG|nr:hypothetical protein BCR33DRAFT_846928 [Rhizoclosmatium globosum]|eukprot:ORY50463.1 hypothetical protein BCR33DRAFT_846928 [Rhizoclosmatium globosum]